MLKNLKNDLNEYVGKHVAEEKKFLEVKKLMLERYSDAVYQQKAEEAQAAYLRIVDGLFKDYSEKVKDQFNEAEKAIRSLVMMPIPQDMINSLGILEQIENPTEEEIKAIFEATGSNYLASKKAHDAFNANEAYSEKVKAYLNGDLDDKPFFIPMDHVIGEIGDLRSYVMGAIFKSSTTDFINQSYAVRNVLGSDWIQKIEANTNDFLNRYKA